MICPSSRRGFSLLEVMIATAVLAASAMVLLSLISLGTRFGSKAETRIGALVQAQSILDESILRIHSGESIESYTGVLAGSPPRGYRVTVEPFELRDLTATNGSFGQPSESASSGFGESNAGSFGSNGPSIGTTSAADAGTGLGNAVGLGTAPADPQPSELVSVQVEVYESEGGAANMPSASLAGGVGVKAGPKPLIQLTRLVRRAPVATNQAATNQAATIPPSGGLRGR